LCLILSLRAWYPGQVTFLGFDGSSSCVQALRKSCLPYSGDMVLKKLFPLGLAGTDPFMPITRPKGTSGSISSRLQD